MTLIVIGVLVWLLFNNIRLRRQVRYLEQQMVADLVQHHQDLTEALKTVNELKERAETQSLFTLSPN